MQKFTNNASSNLSSAISISDTTLYVTTGKGSLFATLGVDDYQLATITDGTNIEIVKITARSGDAFTVARGYDATVARAWSAGAAIEARLDASTLYKFPQLASYSDIIGIQHLDGLTLQTSRASSDKCASGNNSIAIGVSSKSNGSSSISIGRYSQSAGFVSVAIGDNALAAYQYSVSIGNAAESYEEGSVAIGTTAYAGWHSVVIGYGASGTHAGNVAIGNGAFCNGDWMIAIGQTSSCYGGGGTAVGVGAGCSGDSALSLGLNAQARVARSTAISGPIIIRKDDGIGAADANLYLTGAEIVYTSKEIDFKTTQTVTIDIPTGAKFYPDEVGVIVTTVSSPTAQPTVSFGIMGSNASLLAATATTKSTQFERNRYTALLTDDGIQSLTATITVAATGTTFMGRFYFKGLLIEAQ